MGLKNSMDTSIGFSISPKFLKIVERWPGMVKKCPMQERYISHLVFSMSDGLTQRHSMLNLKRFVFIKTSRFALTDKIHGGDKQGIFDRYNGARDSY